MKLTDQMIAALIESKFVIVSPDVWDELINFCGSDENLNHDAGLFSGINIVKSEYAPDGTFIPIPETFSSKLFAADGQITLDPVQKLGVRNESLRKN